jgi:hypothetical protein
LDVFVRPFPGSGGPWRVSTNGGVLPAWSRSEQALAFVDTTSAPRLMVAPFSVAGDSFRADAPRPWAATEQNGGREMSDTD